MKQMKGRCPHNFGKTSRDGKKLAKGQIIGKLKKKIKPEKVN